MAPSPDIDSNIEQNFDGIWSVIETINPKIE